MTTGAAGRSSGEPASGGDLDRWQEEIHWLRGLALRLVRDADIAEDLVQETALVALRRSSRLDPHERRWRAAVLKQLFLNRGRSLSRRRRREQERPLPDLPPPPDELVEQVEVHRRLTDAILALEEPYRATVIRRFFHERTSADIAREEGVAEGTVRSRLSRALAQLRAQLDHLHDGDRKKWVLPLIAWWAASEGGVAGAAAGGGVSGSGAALAGSGSAGGIVVVKKIAVLVAVALLAVFLWPDGSSTGPSRSVEVPTAPLAKTETGTRPTTEGPPSLAVATEPPRLAGPLWRGVVLERSSLAPIAGATVRGFDRGGNPIPDSEVTTDASGAFSISVGPGPVVDRRLVVTAKGHVAGRVELDSFARPEGAPVRVLLSEGRTLRGLVVDPEGRPVSAARVLATGGAWIDSSSGETRWRGDRTPEEIRTEEDGTFTVVLPAGRARVIARSPAGIGVATADLPDDAPLRITLDPEHQLEGVVVDAGGAPVPGARLIALLTVPPSNGSSRGWRLSDVGTRTDTQGLFTHFTQGPAVGVKIDHEAHAPFTWFRSTVDPRSTDPAEPLRIELPASTTLTGVLVDRDGLAFEGSGLRLQVGQEVVVPAFLEGGEFRFEGVDPGRASGELRLDGAIDALIAWPVGGGSHDLGMIEIDRGDAVRVAIVDGDGSPIEGAVVRVQGPQGLRRDSDLARAVTGSDGRTVLRGVSPVDAKVVAYAVGFARAEARVVPGDAASIVTLVLPPESEIVGRVVDENGVPIEGVRCSLGLDTDGGLELWRFEWPYDEVAREEWQPVTAKDGVVRFPFAPSDERLFIEAGSPRTGTRRFSIEPLGVGERRDLGDLVLARGRSLTVEVRDPEGTPVEGAHCTLRTSGGGGGASRGRSDRRVDFTDATGTAVIAGLDASSGSLEVIAAGYPARRVPWTADEAEIHVRLDRGLTWDLAVIDDTGRPVEGATVTVGRETAVTDLQGSAIVTGLEDAPTSWRVTATGFSVEEGRRVPFSELPSLVTIEPVEMVTVTLSPRTLLGSPQTLQLRSSSWVELVDAQGRSIPIPLDVESGVAREQVPVGDYAIVITVPGAARIEESLRVTAGAPVERAFTLVPTGIEVTCLVTDAAGTPVSGTVVVRNQDIRQGMWSTEFERAPDGSYRGQVPDDDVSRLLRVTAPGFAPCVIADVRASETPWVVRLEEESRLEGVITEGDGAPAAGVLVTVYPEVPHNSHSTQTDGRGRFSLTGLPIGPAGVSLQRESERRSETIDLIAGKTHRVEWSLGGAVEFSGRVVSTTSHPEKQLHWLFENGTNGRADLGPDGRFRATSSAGGRAHFTLFAFDPSEGTISMSAQDLGVATIAPGSTLEFTAETVTCTLRVPEDRCAAWEGRAVRLSGIPPSRSMAMARFDATGRATVTALAAGRYQVTPTDVSAPRGKTDGAEAPRTEEILDPIIELREGTVDLAVGASEVISLEGAEVLTVVEVDVEQHWHPVRALGRSPGTQEFVLPQRPGARTILAFAQRSGLQILTAEGDTISEQFTLPPGSGGMVWIAPWSGPFETRGGTPDRLRFVPLEGQEIPPILAERRFPAGDAPRMQWQVKGRMRVEVLDAAGDLLVTRTIVVPSGGKVTVDWSTD